MLFILANLSATQPETQKLGYQRTLQASDLWTVDESRSAATLSAKLDESWQKRKRAAEEWNEALRRGEIEPTLFRKFIWCLRSLVNGSEFQETFHSFEREWREKTGLKEPSLAFALNDTLGRIFWSGGAIKVCCRFDSRIN